MRLEQSRPGGVLLGGAPSARSRRARREQVRQGGRRRGGRGDGSIVVMPLLLLSRHCELLRLLLELLHLKERKQGQRVLRLLLLAARVGVAGGSGLLATRAARLVEGRVGGAKLRLRRRRRRGGRHLPPVRLLAAPLLAVVASRVGCGAKVVRLAEILVRVQIVRLRGARLLLVLQVVPVGRHLLKEHEQRLGQVAGGTRLLAVGRFGRGRVAARLLLLEQRHGGRQRVRVHQAAAALARVVVARRGREAGEVERALGALPLVAVGGGALLLRWLLLLLLLLLMVIVVVVQVQVLVVLSELQLHLFTADEIQSVFLLLFTLFADQLVLGHSHALASECSQLVGVVFVVVRVAGAQILSALRRQALATCHFRPATNLLELVARVVLLVDNVVHNIDLDVCLGVRAGRARRLALQAERVLLVPVLAARLSARAALSLALAPLRPGASLTVSLVGLFARVGRVCSVADYVVVVALGVVVALVVAVDAERLANVRQRGERRAAHRRGRLGVAATC